MPIKVTINGILYTCDTVAEALELGGHAKNSLDACKSPRQAVNVTRGPGRPPKNGSTAMRESKLKIGVARTLAFLRLVEQSGRNGISGIDVVMALDLNDPRAVGGTIVRAQSTLKKCGCDPKRAFRKHKSAEGNRWNRGPDLEAAIETLEKSQGGG